MQWQHHPKPPQPLKNAVPAKWSGGQSEALPIFNVGCSGWFYWHWRGVFYPQTMPTKGWFGHYASEFHTVELNAPFYSWPTVNVVRGWLKQAEGAEMVYTVKVCELITHVKRFARTQLLVKDFGHIADLLGERMGCFLFQFPPSYQYTAARLKTIVLQLDSTRRNVVEFRHRTWWNEKVYAAFRKKGIIFCSCSAPNLPDELIRTAEEFTFVSTAKRSGIGTTTHPRNSVCGGSVFKTLERHASGRISTTTVMPSPSKMRKSFCVC